MSKNSSGVTMIEALLFLAVTSLVGLILVAVMVNSAGLYYKESSKVQQGLGLNEALTKIRTNLREAASVASSFTDQATATTYTSSVSQLVVKIPSLDASGNVIATTFDYAVFFLDGSILRFKLFQDQLSSRKSANEVLTTVGESILFKYFDLSNPPLEVPPTSAKKVQIILTVKQKAGISFETSIATSEANLRND